jgi:hypothetical protein
VISACWRFMPSARAGAKSPSLILSNSGAWKASGLGLVKGGGAIRLAGRMAA